MRDGVGRRFSPGWWAFVPVVLTLLGAAFAQQEARKPTSYAPVDIREDFASVLSRMSAAKAEIVGKQRALLEERYDLADRPASGVTMSRGKAVQEGVRVKLPAGMTWEKLAAMTPDQIRSQGAWPAGFYPLPHPNHPEGGMLFPKFHIEEIKKQEQRDLTRFDLDFDLPDHVLPEFPPPIYLTTRPDLGDVSQGKLVTIENFFELFNGISESETNRGTEAPPHAVSTAAVQPDGGPEDRTPEPRGHVLRVSRQRTYQRLDSPRRRYPAAGVPASHRHAESPRSEHPAALRFSTGAQERRRLHGVRAACGVFRRRPGHRDEKRREPPRPREPGPFHGRVPGAPGFSTRTEARNRRKAGPVESERIGDERADALSREGAVRNLPRPAVLHGQSDAQPEDGALLRAQDDQRPDGESRRSHQDLPPSRRQGFTPRTFTMVVF